MAARSLVGPKCPLVSEAQASFGKRLGLDLKQLANV
jgi:hypothetical protein